MTGKIRDNKMNLLILLGFMLLAASIALHGASASEAATGKVTIKRDGWGVPHVYAEDTYGLYYGYGYALAVDRLFQMEMVKRSVLGTVAEVMGSDYISLDESSRMNFNPQAIRQQLDELQEEDLDIFRGYAAGFNARIEEVLAEPDQLLPRQFSEFDFKPTQWRAFDVAMLYVGTMAGRYSNSSSEIGNLALLEDLQEELGDETGWQLFDQIRWLEDPQAPTTVPRDAADAESVAAEAEMTMRSQSELAPVSDQLLQADSPWRLAWRGIGSPADRPKASNLWILGPDRTVDGSTIFINGPQFGWFNPAYTYSIGLHGAGYDVTGNTPFALPVILFGTNGQIAWGSTAGPLDVNDYYQLQLNPDNPHEYLYKGEYRQMDKRSERISVRDGEDVRLDVYSSEYGTVTSFDPDNDTAYAFRRSWKGYEIQSLMAWIHSTRAQNWEQWLQQASKVATTINWYYADAEGNIGYVSPGYLPIRPDEQDIRLPAVGDGSMDWQGIRPFSDVPKVYNPAQGYIANWNNQPAPGEVAHGDGANWSAVDRVNELIARIEENSPLTREQAWALLEETSFADVNARYFMPYIERATSDLTADDGAVHEAVRRLRDWDMRNTNPVDGAYYAEPAVTIFRAWLDGMIETVLADELAPVELTAGYPGEFSRASVSPGNGSKLLYNALRGDAAGVPQHIDFFQGADEAEKLAVVRDVLENVVAELTDEFGPDQSTWLTPVTRHRFLADNFLGAPQAGPDEELQLPTFMNRGTQNHRVIFGDDGVSLCTVAPPGQSGFVAPDGTEAAHYRDQMDLYEDFDCKSEWLTAAEVEAHAVSTTELEYDRDD